MAFKKWWLLFNHILVGAIPFYVAMFAYNFPFILDMTLAIVAWWCKCQVLFYMHLLEILVTQQQ
jgi:hypothetical protein